MGERRARGGGERPVSASSFLGLKADVAAARQRRAAGGSSDVPRPGRLGDAFEYPAKRRRGAAGASAPAPPPDDDALRASHAALERKARAYEKRARGKQGGVDEQRIEGLVDWDVRSVESDPESDGEAAASPSADDPLVEYLDEFGRTRTAPRSEVPRGTLGAHDADDQEAYENAIYGPAQAFPVYTRQARQLDTAPRAASPEAEHFDADREVRTRGAAFFKFDRDERRRREQQAELRALREETRAAREQRAEPGSESRSHRGRGIRGDARISPHAPPEPLTEAPQEPPWRPPGPPPGPPPGLRPISAAAARRSERQKEVDAHRARLQQGVL